MKEVYDNGCNIVNVRLEDAATMAIDVPIEATASDYPAAAIKARLHTFFSKSLLWANATQTIAAKNLIVGNW